MKAISLSALCIGNFKAFGDTQTIPIKPITLIFGPNSAGKSSIIQSLIFAHEAATQYQGKSYPLDVHSTVLGGDSIDLGGFDNFVHRSSLKAQSANEVEWGLDFPVTSKRLKSQLPNTETVSVRIKFRRVKVHLLAEELTVSSVEIRLDGVEFCRFDIDVGPYRSFPDDMTLKLTSLQLENPAASTLLDHAIRLASSSYPHEVNRPIVNLPIPKGNSTPRARRLLARQASEFIILTLKCKSRSLLDFDVTSFFQDAFFRSLNGREPLPKQSPKIEALNNLLTTCIEDIFTSATDAISYIEYLGPLRQVPNRLLIPQKETESITNADGMRSYTKLLRRPALVKQVSEWLEKLGFGYTLEVEGLIRSSKLNEMSSEAATQFLEAFRSSWPAATDYIIPRLFLQDKRSGIEVSMKDIGTGVVQALPVIASLVSARRSVVAIEQPELHLHPKLQADLGDLFIDSAIAKRNTIIAETHSEHLILRILRRIRETTDSETTNSQLPEGMKPLRPDDVCVLYVQPGSSGSTVMHLEITPDGDFVQRCPEGFFADRLEELF